MNPASDHFTPPDSEPYRLLRAAAIMDGNGVQAAPGALLVHGTRIIAAGTPQQVGEPAHDRPTIVEDHSDSLLIPALVNAHAHLDLTHIGPQPFTGDFASWADRIRTGRARDDAGIAESVEKGVELSRSGGVAMVGDIAGARSTTPTAVLRASGLGGVSFLEFFGVGGSQRAAIEFIRDAIARTSVIENGVRFGLQPHAPYSCGPNVYRFAANQGLPLSTHLAETVEEMEFVREATGPLAGMLKHIGVWDDSIRATGLHAVDYIAELIGNTPCVAAHLNYIEDEHLTLLARLPISVAFCPRASDYFDHFGHRYLSMIAAGINVALGTDSVVCLDTPDRISTLDEMCMLFQRDGTDPAVLLRMATINGAHALGMNPSLVSFTPDESAGVLALSLRESASSARLALMQVLGYEVLRHDESPRWVVGPVTAKNEWSA